MIRTRIGLWMLAALAAGLLGSSAQAQTFKPFTDVATVCPECWAQRYDHIALKGGQVVYARVLAENPAFYVLERFGELRAVGRDKVERMTRALLEWETIDSDQIDDIMAGHEPRPPKPVAPPTSSNSSPSAPAPTTTPAAGGVD